MKKLYEIKNILEKEGLMNRKIPFEERYLAATKNKTIRGMLGLETPEITDFTELLQIKNNGKLYAVRMDLNKGVDNHKKLTIAGLILRGVLNRKIPKKEIDTLIDGGNASNGLSIRHFAKELGMKGVYHMSYLFPESIINMIKAPDFKVIISPRNKELSVEEEFYADIFNKMKDEKFRKNKFCLWHAKYSGKAMYPFGREIASKLKEAPDYTVSCLGAGSTLEGVQFAIQDHFTGSKVFSIVGEHELTPLFSDDIVKNPEKYKEGVYIRTSLGIPKNIEKDVGEIDVDFYWSHPDKRVPHMVIGPHYEKINPLLSEKVMARIDGVIHYSEDDWMFMHKYLEKNNISVGNSSAANLSVAANLANEGKKVLTVIFEPFREFYKAR